MLDFQVLLIFDLDFLKRIDRSQDYMINLNLIHQTFCVNFQNYIYFSSLLRFTKLNNIQYRELRSIITDFDIDESVRLFNKWLKDDTNLKRLLAIFPIVICTNLSSEKLGSPKPIFDLVIMDEAGQCNVAHSLIPICKAESLLLVGDPNQLKPVVLLEDHINDKLMEKFNVPDLYDYKKYCQ